LNLSPLSRESETLPRATAVFKITMEL